jgi:hypothetical protein
MICSHCLTDTVEWVGRATDLNGTKCSSCGRENCQEVITDPGFYDCECESDYIHPKGQVCPRCNADEDEQPDARVAELIQFGMVNE